MVPHIFPVLNQMHRLTSLELPGAEHTDAGGYTQIAWEPLVAALSKLSNLQKLQIGPQPDCDNALLMNVLRALWKLTGLTELALEWGLRFDEGHMGARLYGTVAAEGLQGLTHLRVLRLAGFVPVHEAELWAGVAALPCLEVLDVDQQHIRVCFCSMPRFSFV